MKTIAIMKIGFLLASATLLSANQVDQFTDVEKAKDEVLACAWIPICHEGPELYSPVPQPRDNKTETQDTKDEKLA